MDKVDLCFPLFAHTIIVIISIIYIITYSHLFSFFHLRRFYIFIDTYKICCYSSSPSIYKFIQIYFFLYFVCSGNETGASETIWHQFHPFPFPSPNMMVMTMMMVMMKMMMVVQSDSYEKLSQHRILSVFICLGSLINRSLGEELIKFSSRIDIDNHSAFLCISLHVSAFLCISLHFSAFLCISRLFSAFLCILYFRTIVWSVTSSYGRPFFKNDIYISCLPKKPPTSS